MGPERDSAEANQDNGERRRRKNQHATATAFNHRNKEQSELPIKQRGANGVAAGETVTRPIDKPAIDEWTMSMNQNFEPLIQEHATRYCHNCHHQRRPPAFESEKEEDRKSVV